MKELTVTEIMQVNGAGVIESVLGGIGGGIANGVYGLIGSVFGGINIELPLLGSININQLMPGLGNDVGSMIGKSVGSTIENVLTTLPVVGGVLGWLLG